VLYGYYYCIQYCIALNDYFSQDFISVDVAVVVVVVVYFNDDA